MSQSPMARISPFHAVALSWVPTTSLGLNLGFGGGAGDWTCFQKDRSTTILKGVPVCLHKASITPETDSRVFWSGQNNCTFLSVISLAWNAHASCCIFSGRFISFISFIRCFMGCFSMFSSFFIPLYPFGMTKPSGIPTTGSASSRRLGCGLSSTQP